MDLENQGELRLAYAWWTAIDDLVDILENSYDADTRIAAARVVLDYTSKMNVGLGEPFIPEDRVEMEYEEESEDE